MPTRFLLILAMTLCTLLACSRESSWRGRQDDFEVVAEGSASGVSATIAAPGETLPPLTDTSADTTTAFDAVPMGTDTFGTTTEGSLASSLPPIDETPHRSRATPFPPSQRSTPPQTDVAPAPAPPPTETSDESPMVESTTSGESTPREQRERADPLEEAEKPPAESSEPPPPANPPDTV